jgi:non-ribosomal peptide synthetase component F
VSILANKVHKSAVEMPLLVGARLVVASREATYDGRLLMELLVESGATVMQATPTTWRLLFESGWTGDRKLKVLGGGAASPFKRLLRCFSSRVCYAPRSWIHGSGAYSGIRQVGGQYVLRV